MKIVLTGIQWCWKWTQARLLSEKFWFTLLEMWWEFRKIITSGTILWNKIKAIIDDGNQVWEDLWKEVMENILQNYKNGKILFDWFIRNNWNKKIFDKIIPEYRVLYFHFSKEKAIQRLIGRMYDPISEETFPSGTVLNPKTWNILIKRADDHKTAILKRIEEYTTKTLPILELQKQEWKVIEINADNEISKVQQEIILKLWL